MVKIREGPRQRVLKSWKGLVLLTLHVICQSKLCDELDAESTRVIRKESGTNKEKPHTEQQENIYINFT